MAGPTAGWQTWPRVSRACCNPSPAFERLGASARSEARVCAYLGEASGSAGPQEVHVSLLLRDGGDDVQSRLQGAQPPDPAANDALATLQHLHVSLLARNSSGFQFLVRIIDTNPHAHDACGAVSSCCCLLWPRITAGSW